MPESLRQTPINRLMGYPDRRKGPSSLQSPSPSATVGERKYLEVSPDNKNQKSGKGRKVWEARPCSDTENLRSCLETRDPRKKGGPQKRKDAPKGPLKEEIGLRGRIKKRGGMKLCLGWTQKLSGGCQELPPFTPSVSWKEAFQKNIRAIYQTRGFSNTMHWFGHYRFECKKKDKQILHLHPGRLKGDSRSQKRL